MALPLPDSDTLCGDLFVNLATRRVPFTFGPLSLTVEVSTAACTDHDLTGQTTWPGASILCHWLAAQPASFFAASTPALELGAGTGLAGLYFYARGGDIRLTDYQPVVLDLLARNAASVTTDVASGGSVHVSPLLWGDSAAHAELLSHTPDSRGFPVLLAADVVYPGSQAALPGLVDSVCSLLAPGGSLFLSYCSRAKTTDVALFDAIRDAGLETQQVSDVYHEGCVAGVVYRVQRSPGGPRPLGT